MSEGLLGTLYFIVFLSIQGLILGLIRFVQVFGGRGKR